MRPHLPHHYCAALALSWLIAPPLGATPQRAAGPPQQDAQPGGPGRPDGRGGGDTRNQRRSPVQRRRRPRQEPQKPARFPMDMRTIDGANNNPMHPAWGSAGSPFLRLTAPAYADGVEAPAGADRPNVRMVSNLCVAQPQDFANPVGASDMLWQWGQFLDHDIDETPIADPAEPFDITVPIGDPWFDPDVTGKAQIPLDRSSYDVIDGVREQVNEITAFIDASNVYGSDAIRAAALRTLDGTGRLRTSAGNLLPFNDVMLPNAPANTPIFFLAGDIRANEQVALTALHTLFVREHNRWADSISADEPQLTGEQVYQRARAIVAAEIQAITYNEFLPVLLGADALAPYQGYDAEVNPGITNVFATAAYRFGHSMLSEQVLRLEADGSEASAGHLALANAFFSPSALIKHDIDSILRGLSTQQAQRIDPYIIDAVRNFLFAGPGSSGFDLAALNMQRGRDHGLPSFNGIRAAYGLPPITRFDQLTPDPEIRQNMAAAYGSPDMLDPWIGGLAERPAPGGMVGETWSRVLRDQFERLRDGDRFWYVSYLPPDMVEMIERQTLATIIRRNTAIGDELQDNVFVAREAASQ